ncbi:MAG: NAD(P)-dependent oxidoreductase [Oligoflexales bacterium]
MYRILNLDPKSFKGASLDLLMLNAQIDSHEQIGNIDRELTKKYLGMVCRLGVTLDAQILSRFENLSFIATVTTGLDHIDLDYCDRNNINVISLKNEKQFLHTIRATPEHTWALLLALLRRIEPAFQSVKEQRWERQNFFGRELFGKKIGIIGFGRVGSIIGRYANAFGMEVIANDIVDIMPGDFLVRQVSLNQLLEDSDIVTVHVPLESDTANLIGYNELSLMKRSSFLVNTSRGAIVNESALIKALENSIIAGAAVDVLSDETKPNYHYSSNKMISFAASSENLLITPHIAGSTIESMENTSLFIAKKIVKILERLKYEL